MEDGRTSPAGWGITAFATWSLSKPREHLLAALDLLTALRHRWPGEKLHLVMDNFSPHRHPTVRAWAAANDVELVFLPTYGSWLNWIEAEFAAPLRPQRHRPPRSHRTERRHRRLHPLAQRTSPAQDRLRDRFTHPHLDPLPSQRRVTHH